MAAPVSSAAVRQKRAQRPSAVGLAMLVVGSFCIASAREATRHTCSASPRLPRTISAFGDPKYFTDTYISTNTPGVKIKVPDFDVLFEVIS